MKIEMSNYHHYSAFFATIFVYISGIYLYLINFISGITFFLLLLVLTIVLVFFLISIRKTSIKKRALVFSILSSLLILVYEIPNILLDQYFYLVTHYNEPEELIKDSGLFILSVKIDQIGPVESEEVLKDSYIFRQIKFYEIIPASNIMRYRSKNEEVFELVGLVNDDYEQMSVDVKSYLKTDQVNPAIEEFLARENSTGSSAGLALVLSSLVAKGTLQNEKLIGITGAINKRGKVIEVAAIKEKMLIANENRFSHIIIPSANLDQAIEVKKTMNLPIEIKGVHNVDEAVKVIEELNKR